MVGAVDGKLGDFGFWILDFGSVLGCWGVGVLGGVSNGWAYDGWVTVATLGLALGWLLVVNVGAKVYQVPSTLSRKIIHTGTGPLFVLCWPLFSDAVYARYLAAIVPLGLTLVFFGVGMGWLDNPDLVQASTRSGDRTELLKGPLYYGLAFILCTILFWRTSPDRYFGVDDAVWWGWVGGYGGPTVGDS